MTPSSVRPFLRAITGSMPALGLSRLRLPLNRLPPMGDLRHVSVTPIKAAPGHAPVCPVTSLDGQELRIGRATLLVSIALNIAASGCSTMIKGTTQRIAVVTDPPGAQCTLKNARSEATVIIPATPGEVEVRRDRSPIEVRCMKDGQLDISESYPASYAERGDESHRRQVIVAESLLRTLEVNQSQTAAVEAAEAQGRLVAGAGAATGIASVALPATVAATAAPTLGGGAAIAGAGVVAAPLLLGLIVAVPISLAVDYGTGAIYSYPPVFVLLMPTMTFADELTRDTYFAGVNQRFDVAAEALREDTKASCHFFNCDRRTKEDDAFVAEWRARVADTRSKTRLATRTDPEASPSEGQESKDRSQ